jgi:hypothetical protein
MYIRSTHCDNYPANPWVYYQSDLWGKKKWKAETGDKHFKELFVGEKRKLAMVSTLRIFLDGGGGACVIAKNRTR